MSSALEEKERVHKLLTDALPLLCKNAVHYDGEISIEALVGITIDQDKVLLVSIKKNFQKEIIRPPPKSVTSPMPSRRQLRQQQQQQRQLQQQKQQQQLLRQQQLMQQQWLLDYDDDEDEEEDEEEEEEEEWQRQAMLIHQQRQQKVEQQQQQEDTLMRIRQAALTAATGGSMSAMRKLRNQELPKRRVRDPPPVIAKPLVTQPPNRLRRPASTVTSVTSSSDHQPSPVKRLRSSPAVKQPMVISIKKESEEPTYTGVYMDSQPPSEIIIKTEVKEEPNDINEDAQLEEKTPQAHVTKKSRTKPEPKPEPETEQESQPAKEEEIEDEEEEEFYEGKTNQTGEDGDDPEVASKLLDIPVRIPATEVKKHFRIVKGETVDDESGTQSQTAAYCCNKCGKTYESEIAIEDHILVSHMKILRYSCPTCGQHFGFRSALTAHMREDHETESKT